jgi:hypothetical protein
VRNSGPAAGSAAPPPDRDRAWAAEIEWRETEAGALFCVIARADDEAAEVTVAHSGPLNWPPARGESVRALTDAVDQLEAALLAAQWKPLPRGSRWYAKRFRSEPLHAAAPARLGPAGAAPPGRADGIRSVFSERSVVRRPLPVAVVAVLVVAAAVTGLLLARSLGGGDAAHVSVPAATPLTIAHDGLRLQVPSGWAPGEAAMVPGFSRPLFLDNASERLSVVVERLPATSASLLPLALEKALPGARKRRQRVRLASGQPAWRYRVAQAGGSAILLYAAPTTTGVATVACMSPTAAGLPRRCEALADAITVPGSLPLDLSASAAFYSRLPAAVKQLEAARSTGLRELSTAKSAVGQAAAADGLVRAHKAASAALAPLTPADAGLPAKTVAALNATAGAYATLAGAARARSRHRYDDAGRGVADADAGLRRTLSQAAAAAKAASRAATAGESP